jgi:hypothetical protein
VTLAAARETLGTRALGLRTWQLSPIWVVGLEADLQGALEKESSTVTNNFQFTIGNPPSGGVTGTAVAQYTAKIDWFGTVRLRAGYAWGNGDVLSYVTGGLAYGKVDLEGTNTVSGTVDGSLFSFAQTFGHSHVNTGWVVGTGTEGKNSSAVARRFAPTGPHLFNTCSSRRRRNIAHFGITDRRLDQHSSSVSLCHPSS